MAKYDLSNAKPFNEQPLYKQGFDDAIDKACEWLKSQADECFVSGDSVGEHLVFKDLSLAGFLKAMGE